MKWNWMLLGLLAVAWGVGAQEAPSTGEQAARELVAGLHWRDGEIAIDGANARIHLNDSFRYLPAADARKVLENLWGNPPDDSVLGMIVPKGHGILDDKGWVVVVTYSDEGYVSDEDASKIDYDDLLKDMKEGAEEANSERKRAGYPTVTLHGWAEPPHYDASAKKLYWAKALQFEGADGPTVNYDIRVLGRKGYVSLNAIAQMSELGEVRSGMQQVLPLVEFDNGSRYADYNKGTDKVAAYGIAALIGGGIAAKAGLFAKLGVLLLSLKKGLIVVVMAIAAGFKKILGLFNRDRKNGGNVVS